MRERSRGVWELIVHLGRDPLTGRRRQRSRTFRGTKREAERALRSLIASVEHGHITGTDTTLDGLLKAWLELAADQLSPTTLREYRRLVDRRIAPGLGKTPLVKVTTPVLDDFYRALSDDAGLSASSIRQIHSIIRRGLKQGVKWGWIANNPAVNATPPILRRRRIKPPSVAVIRQLVEVAEQVDDWFGLLVRLAIATGLRRGELCGLQWHDVDFGVGQLEVSRSVAATKDGPVVKSTKTGNTRKLSLDEETLGRLLDHRQAMAQRAAIEGLSLVADAYIFSFEFDCGFPIHPDKVTAAFRRLPENKGVRFHDLRHAHATQLLARGVDISTVSGRLGHSNTSTTLNIYAHVLDANDRAAADLIGDLLG
ncbi:MAG: site-specific integrase [bacterium]|nr:site-specific integrase [bacterium]